MVLSRKSCPVPIDQQPLEEYRSLILSKFFALPAKEFRLYFLFLLLLYSFFILLINVTFFPNVFFLYLGHQILLTILIVSDILVELFILRLYFSWSYVSRRLLSAIVFYEESGWYDGQIWIKTTDVLIQDRLIAINFSLPLINRIQFSILTFVTKMLLEIFMLSYF